MKIAVCLKEAPGRDTRYQVAPDQRWIDESQVSFEMSECDEYALEAALRLKDQSGFEVVVAMVGLARAERSLRKALAMGADRAILINDPERSLSSPAAVAWALRMVLQDEGFALVLAGTQSDDYGYAQTGVMLAEYLGFSHATLAMEVQVDAGSGSVSVLREMESGWFQRVDLPLPAVLTIQAGASPVRYASLKGIMQAKKKEVRVLHAAALGLDLSGLPEVSIERAYVPVSERQAEILTGGTEVAVAALLDRLRRDGLA